MIRFALIVPVAVKPHITPFDPFKASNEVVVPSPLMPHFVWFLFHRSHRSSSRAWCNWFHLPPCHPAAMTVCMRKLVILMNRLLKNPHFHLAS
jgi:hypothetical protein